MAKKKQNKKRGQDDKKFWAFIATFLSIIGFIITLLIKKDDEYVIFYAKQSLVVFIVFVIAWAVMIVPILGWIVGAVIYIIGVILWIISWIYAISGDKKEVPIVGKYVRNVNL